MTRSHLTLRRLLALTSAVLLSLVMPFTALAQGTGPLRVLGELIYPSGTTFQDTTVGGLSGLAYDARRGVYYAVSDDRGEQQAPRFYTLQIDLSGNALRDVRLTGVTTIDSDRGAPGVQPYERNASDLEEVVLLPNGQLVISSERDQNNAPWLRTFNPDGTLTGELTLPDKFRPAQGRGVRSNLGFEGMALTPDGATLYVVNEDALAQDGPITTPDAGSQVRILRYDLRGGTWAPGAEYVYRPGPIFARPTEAGAAADNGVSGMVWVRHVLPQYDVIVMERSFVTGRGNDVNLYGVTLAGADNVSSVDALPTPFTGRAVTKTLLLNLTAAGFAPDNLEGIALGPRLPNGRQSLVLMTDDNFNPTQRSQFVLIEVAGIGLPGTGDGSAPISQGDDAYYAG
jgi:3-phytase